MNRLDLDFKKRWLEWVLDFIHSDLNALPKSRMRGLSAEAFYFCSMVFKEEPFERLLWNFPFDKLPEIQIGDFNEIFLNQLRKEYEREISSDEVEELISNRLLELPSIQAGLKYFFEETQAALEKTNSPRPPTMTMEDWYPQVILPDTENRIEGFRGSYWRIFIVPKSYSTRDLAILNFARLMDGLHVSAIKKCAGCGCYFFNASKREKIYCSFTCASRSIAHKRYEEIKKDPKKYEAHLKKYRKYSSERYRRLRQMQFGPHVKINHRRKNRKEK